MKFAQSMPEVGPKSPEVFEKPFSEQTPGTGANPRHSRRAYRAQKTLINGPQGRGGSNMADLIIRGKPFHKIDPTFAKILEQLFPEDVQKTQPPRSFNLGQGNSTPVSERKPQWSVGFQPRNGRAVLNLLTPLGEHIAYQYAPKDAQATFTKMGWPVPEQFLKAYTDAYKQQPEAVWREATEEDNLMARHLSPARFASVPKGYEAPISEPKE